MRNQKDYAFTLAELLIALGILGVIATFSIPKVLQAQQSSEWNTRAKEAISMLSGAYDAYKLRNTPDANTKVGDLTPYMNYIAEDSTATIDHLQNATTTTCVGSGCLKLHNGGLMRYNLTTSFGGTASTNAIWFNFDPDGKVTTDGTAGTPGKSVSFRLYYNGRITTYGQMFPNTCTQGGFCQNPDPAADPPWFSWN